jgi:3-methyladenine DNA glycosylase AlkD
LAGERLVAGADGMNDRIERLLRTRADRARVPVLQRFFKTGPGQYAEGDIFIGVTVPDLRRTCRECRDATGADVARLLRSRVHEDRMLALLIMVDAFKRADGAGRRAIYEQYLASTGSINNWDLVDTSAAAIVGGWLAERSRRPLHRLARSKSLWERRIAIVATHHFIRKGEVDETFRVADILLHDEHDLIHKAVGWMLREAGKRDPAAAREFLNSRYAGMPRTMLRYAIERFPERERQAYLRGTIGRSPAARAGRR